jgi:ElaB/YqjD/DUF883 family membrane-anchored ribosome-binding protein
MADEIEKSAPKAKIKAKKIDVTPVANAAETIAEEAANTAETFKATASKLGKQAAEKARDYANEGKVRASGALGEVSRLVDQAAGTVDEKLGADYGKYAHNAAETLSGWSEKLKTKELDDFVTDARELVRKSPVVAIGVAAALGFVLARVIRAGTDKNA